MLNDLCTKFIVDRKQKVLLVEGDAKVYEVLKSLKFEYGDELSWLFPYPGDWHMFKNFQIAHILTLIRWFSTDMLMY